jgi:ABC-type dipeptide/oligopeptide/nickel transport system permease component
MTRFIVIRLIQTVIALIGIAVLIFVLVRASGNPIDLLRSATSTPEEIENLQHQLGLDKSNWEQFRIFMFGLAQGDLGSSLLKRRPVSAMIGESLPNSLKLTVPSFIISMIISVALGVFAATRRDSIFDNGVKFLAILGQALPGFWLAIMAMLLFSVYWGILPTAGMGGLDHYILPVGTMSFFMVPLMMRLVRSGMLDVMDSEYIKLARIKGLPERVIIWKHAFRNALIAPLTSAGMLMAGLVMGNVITENIFNWPGMGRLMLEATYARDFPVVQACTLLVGVIVLGMNLLVDITYAYVDPQIRYQRS